MHLNLARKWRSKYFDEVVGQALVVRLVKNSLYRNLIFPVYLLSGTRGCGKTSIARIFAAALNCQAIEQFQKNPQAQQLPCLTCASCEAMQSMRHPDFIEIDAASHTGVDNVRAIIDAAAFVPVLGRKKIYLIDEAHMLSKAAFNAFLKILEEPPKSVVFMLATTDPHKILETVTSRCFQLFFEPIEQKDVVEHLARICAQEEISFEREALALIAQETEGSMRDALNLVERVRIAYPSITQSSVIELLGKIDDDRLCELLNIVLQGSAQDILGAIKRLELERYNPFLVWKSFVTLIGRALWVKNGIAPDESKLDTYLKEITAKNSLERLIKIFEICYDYELSFAKTALPGHMLEMMLLKMAQSNEKVEVSVSTNSSKKSDSGSSPTIKITKEQSIVIPGAHAQETQSKSSEHKKSDATADSAQAPTAIMSKEPQSPWQQCLHEIEKLNDPLVVSIFKQGVLSVHDANTKCLEIIFSQDLLFFKEWLENTQKVWHPTVVRFFGEGTLLVPHFTGPAKERTVKIGQSGTAFHSQSAVRAEQPGGQAASQNINNTRTSSQASGIAKSGPRTAGEKTWTERSRSDASAPSYQKKEKERVVTITDPEKWKKAHALLRIFPGTLTVSQENPDGESA